MKKILKPILKIFLVFVLVIALKSGFDTLFEAVYPLRHENVIDICSERYSLDRYLVMGLIKAESNYIPDAHSGVARGLMQITDDTARWIADKIELEFSPDDIEKPDININMGCYYLSYLKDRYKNTDVALAAYNGGMGNVDKWLSNPDYSSDGKTLYEIPFKETKQYVKKVNSYRKIYKWWYGKKKK